MALFHVRQPGNMSAFTEWFSAITELEIVDMQGILEDYFYLPE